MLSLLKAFRKFKLRGKKLGMAQTILEDGAIVPCTLVSIYPHLVVDRKTAGKEGYDAVVVATNPVAAKQEKTLAKRVNRPQLRFYQKHSLPVHRNLHELRHDQPVEVNVGDCFTIDNLKEIQHVDVFGISKGKGFQGVMKKYNFGGQRKSHGAGPVHRHGGSTGNRSTPGRCFPGGKRASQMGNKKAVVQSLRVLGVENVNGQDVLVIYGAVPGFNGADLFVAPAVKVLHG